MADYQRKPRHYFYAFLSLVLPFILPVISLCASENIKNSTISIGLTLFGLFLAVLNFYLSFVRHFIHQLFFKNQEYKAVSGLPFIATIVANISIIFAFGHTLSACSALAILVLDSGGLPWFVISTWHDKSFWGTQVAHKQFQRS